MSATQNVNNTREGNVNLFHNIKTIAGKFTDTMKFTGSILIGKYRSEEDMVAEINRIRSKWGLPID
jgi:hypothetical protein